MSSSGTLGIVTELDVPMPMREGTILRGNVFRPDAPGPFPALLVRTPYGKAAAGYERYVRAGYVVVSQDTRGRYASDGEFTVFTVSDTGDAEDGYDSIEWLARQPYCNGNVGTLGASYCAWMQWQQAKLRPPSLKAMCAWSIPPELTGVDWCGAFRPARRIRWWLTTIAPDLRRRRGLPPPHMPAEANHLWNEQEHGRWLGFLPWLDIARYLPEPLASQVEDWLRHPARRSWRIDEAYAEIDVPNLDFSGWYDHCGGTMAHLQGMQRYGRTALAREQTKLILGPWNHTGIGARKVGEIDFGPQAAVDLPDLIIRWFDHWLKGVDNGVEDEPPVRYFVMGAGLWKTAATWPPPVDRETCLYLSSHGDAHEPAGSGALTKARPPVAQPPDTYRYDPRDPVPTLWTRELFTVPSDRRALDYRRDILRYRTAPLTEDLEVVGYPEVTLYAASSAPDTDFFARLVDEPPEGPAVDVCYGMVRARHRHSWEREEFLTPGEVTEFPIRLGATACRFQRGHRLLLEITSSDFPNHDRNHNTGRNDLADAELRPADQRVFHTPQYPSRLVLPIRE